jgi:carbon-monoxide dehydrogenase small subunit
MKIVNQLIPIQFKLNGKTIETEVQAQQNIIELLNKLNLKGARESCGQGLCGACTVIVNNKAVSGCLEFAKSLDKTEVRTIEGLEINGALDPIQESFIETGAFQCGFCTPGFILMTEQLLNQNPNPTDDEIRHYLSGNLCRCAAYPEILKAVHLAAQKRASK